ncbi:hypothetical protein ACLQ2N_36065, partial [Streptomyces sp. DT224]|uniref:hypothetical protein n=1 Tax=Streptomyces sp. DT224 TaxID=3393426 RepID=UPI003CF7642E
MAEVGALTLRPFSAEQLNGGASDMLHRLDWTPAPTTATGTAPVPEFELVTVPVTEGLPVPDAVREATGHVLAALQAT